ncbi:hypothetical protein MMC13_000741 [Lambiella insularis]|nr:hypothetical protein [Lambiella insularis]
MEANSQTSSDIAVLKDSSNDPVTSFSEPLTVATTAAADDSSRINGFNSQSVETNGLFPAQQESFGLLVTNGSHSEHETAAKGDAADSLNPPMSKAQLNEDPAVQQPTSDVRYAVEAVTSGSITDGNNSNGHHVTGVVTAQSVPTNGVPQEGGLEGVVDTSTVAEPNLAVQDPMDISASFDSSPHIKEVNVPHHPPVPTIEGQAPEAPLDPPATPVDNGSQLVPVGEDTLATTEQDLQAPSDDHVMQDAPHTQGKIARSREEDEEEDAPATKRMKGEDDGSHVPEFKVPDLPQPVSEVALSSTPIGTTEQATTSPPQRPDASSTSSSSTITKRQHKFLTKGLQNLKRSGAAHFFLTPVDHITLKIPTYPDIIKKPMDLRTMEEKLKNDGYPSIDAYIADFNQIVENSVTFNGPEHTVTQTAYTLKASFDKQMSNLPQANVAEPVRPVKREKSVTSSTASKPAPSRRESRSTLQKPKTPTSASSPQTFALGPQGVPLIRRDSTVQDGRPKREIHPPAPRDLPYSNQKPKKKKYLWELKFCQEVLNEMKKTKYSGCGYPFYNPVDPVALNIPTYHKVIKKPMDLSTIESKLKGSQYENAREFADDMRLMFENCFKFNPEGDNVNAMGKEFQKVFEDEWAKKRSWIESHTPASGLQSPGTSPEPDDGDDDEDDEEDEDEEENQLTALQKQIAGLSEQVMMIQKKKASPPVVSKKTAKGSKSAKSQPKKTASTAVSKSDHKHSSKPTKKAKIPYVTYEQKQDISNRINMLNETNMQKALSIIRKNMPALKGVQEDEIELDIDELSNVVLYQVCIDVLDIDDKSDHGYYQLLTFVRKHAPQPEDSPEPRQVATPAAAAPTRPKKNKPMSKTEQEAKIEEIRSKLSGFDNAASDDSPEPYPQPQAAEDTSGDEDDSEESEED